MHVHELGLQRSAELMGSKIVPWTLHIGSYLGSTILIYDKVVKWYDLALKASIYLINWINLINLISLISLINLINVVDLINVINVINFHLSLDTTPS